MVFDSLRDRGGGTEALTPMGIAHNSLLTAREKIELLNRLKAETAGASEEGGDPGFSAGDVDRAIAAVRQGVQDGVGSQTVLKGDF